MSFSSASFDKKEKNLAYGCRNNVARLDKFNINGVSIFSFKKYVFAYKAFSLMFVNRKLSLEMQTFSQLMQYLITENSLWSFMSEQKSI